jgi:hypothetical protein
MPEGDQHTGKEVRIAGIVLKWIRTDQAGTPKDKNQVFYFDLSRSAP